MPAAMLLVLLVAAVLPSHAATGIQALDSIRSAAEKFIREQVPAATKTADRNLIVTAGYLDSRLRLAPCDGNLTPSRTAATPLGARNTVAVTCTQGADWTVHVPVVVESEVPVLVTRSAIARGAGITAADVEARIQTVPGLALEYVANVAELQGRHSRRPLPVGAPLKYDVLATNLLVKRGQQVTLLAAVGGIEVRAMGRALTDGVAADRIRVQNLNSTRIVEGFVESADIVRIKP